MVISMVSDLLEYKGILEWYFYIYFYRSNVYPNMACSIVTGNPCDIIQHVVRICRTELFTNDITSIISNGLNTEITARNA